MVSCSDADSDGDDMVLTPTTKTSVMTASLCASHHFLHGWLPVSWDLVMLLLPLGSLGMPDGYVPVQL